MMFAAPAVLADSETPLRVGLYPGIAPYVMETNPPSGIDVELVQDLGRRLGRAIELTMLPPARLSRMVLAGQLDMHMLHGTTGMGCTITQPLSFWSDGITVGENVREQVKSVQDLNGLQVAVYPAGEAFLRNQLNSLGATDAIVVVVPKTQLMVNMLLRNRIDAMFSEARITRYLLRLDPSSADVELPEPLMQFPDDHRLCVGDPVLAEKVDTAIDAQLAEGLFDRLAQKYIGPPAH